MALLFPISKTLEFINDMQACRKGSVIFSSRIIQQRVPWILKEKSNVKRVAITNLEAGSIAYFDKIRSMCPVSEFYCNKCSIMVSMGYCFGTCRLIHKLECHTYMCQAWGCLTCPWGNRWVTCNKRIDCVYRKSVAIVINFLFSQLYGFDTEVIKRLNYGLGNKRNAKGIGPQMYYNVGLLPIHNTQHRMQSARKAGFEALANRQKEQERWERRLKPKQQ